MVCCMYNYACMLHLVFGWSVLGDVSSNQLYSNVSLPSVYNNNCDHTFPFRIPRLVTVGSTVRSWLACEGDHFIT